MLKRVRVEGYKSLEDAEARLEPLTVLFGPNAAGKSNFLDALQLLSKLGTSPTLKDAFDPPYRGKPLESFTVGDGGLKGLIEREYLAFSIEVDLELSDTVVQAIDRRDTRHAPPGRRRAVQSGPAERPGECANATCAIGSRSRCCPGPGFCA